MFSFQARTGTLTHSRRPLTYQCVEELSIMEKGVHGSTHWLSVVMKETSIAGQALRFRVQHGARFYRACRKPRDVLVDLGSPMRA